jgi:hypothetical protein
MIGLLNLIGALFLMIFSIWGLMIRSFDSILAGILAGSASSIIFFALARILENQEKIIARLNSKDEGEKLLDPGNEDTIEKVPENEA